MTFDSQTRVESGYDKIFVMDGNGNQIPGSPFTGTDLAGQTKNVPGSTVRIRLTSDSSVTFYGFKITGVTAANNVAPATGGGSVTDLPESSHPYSDNTDRTWTYTLPASGINAINVTFDSQTRVESGYDKIFVMDGNGNQIPGSPFTGTDLAGQTKNVPGSTVRIRLTSDSSVTFYGFKITGVTAANSVAPATGGGSVTDLPESSHPYSDNTDRTWTYTLPASGINAINVTFDSQTRVESGYDKIFVMDGNGNQIPGSPFTGTDLAGQTKNVPGSTVRIRLTSDSSVTFYGFKVTSVNPVQNGGSLQTRRTIFIIHGIAQSGGPGVSAGDGINGLAATLRSSNGVDQSRFVIDENFSYGECRIGIGGHCDSNNCSIPSVAQRLADYINRANPVGEIILIGYSLGGLIARDMILNNYLDVVGNRRVAGLITLGTPSLGYPYQSIDENIRCSVQVQQMSGDFRAGQIQNVVNVSTYLGGVISRWSFSSFLGIPRAWMAAAGRAGNNPARDYDPIYGWVGPGCPDTNPYNDGVVCDQSAEYRVELYNTSSGNLPSLRWSDPNRAYSHTGGTWFVLGSPGGTQPLFNPMGSGDLITQMRNFINGL